MSVKHYATIEYVNEKVDSEVGRLSRRIDEVDAKAYKRYHSLKGDIRVLGDDILEVRQRLSAVEKGLETVVERLDQQTERLDRQTEQLDQHSRTLGEHTKRFDKLEGMLTELLVRVPPRTGS